MNCIEDMGTLLYNNNRDIDVDWYEAIDTSSVKSKISFSMKGFLILILFMKIVMIQPLKQPH